MCFRSEGCRKWGLREKGALDGRLDFGGFKRGMGGGEEGD